MTKILVVDDDPALAELIADFCREAGFDARTVTDSQKVMDIALEWQPNLITLDLEMPGMDGVEVLRRLQAQPQTSRIPVVIISVVARGAFEKGLLKGARMVFEKPLKLQKLMEKLQELATSPGARKDPHFEPFSK
jgi:CheY-like chemotaxis protein